MKSTKTWEGHVGFVINVKQQGNYTYILLLGGNQNDQVCVQEFKLLKEGSVTKAITERGTRYTLAGYVYPKEYELNIKDKHFYKYKTSGYVIKEAISDR